MTITIDAAGRLVLPKAIRDKAQLAPGVPIDVRVADGRVILEPACAEVIVEDRGGLWVAAPVEPPPPLRQAEVDATIEAARLGGGGVAADDV